LKRVFQQKQGYKKSGNPVNNQIRAIEVNSRSAHFICSTIPGDFSLSQVFRAAGLRVREGWRGNRDTVTVALVDLPAAFDALLGGVVEPDRHSAFQRQFLLALRDGLRQEKADSEKTFTGDVEKIGEDMRRGLPQALRVRAPLVFKWQEMEA
jgi:hypothetical protein